MNYYLLDLERTVGSTVVHYWNANKRGYTHQIEAAGKFSEVEAFEITQSDVNKRTIMISEDEVKAILGG